MLVGTSIGDTSPRPLSGSGAYASTAPAGRKSVKRLGSSRIGGAFAEVVEACVRRGAPDADLAALGVEERPIGRVQRHRGDQRAVLADPHLAARARLRAQHAAIRERRGLVGVQRPGAICAQDAPSTPPTYTALLRASGRGAAVGPLCGNGPTTHVPLIELEAGDVIGAGNRSRAVSVLTGAGQPPPRADWA